MYACRNSGEPALTVKTLSAVFIARRPFFHRSRTSTLRRRSDRSLPPKTPLSIVGSIPVHDAFQWAARNWIATPYKGNPRGPTARMCVAAIVAGLAASVAVVPAAAAKPRPHPTYAVGELAADQVIERIVRIYRGGRVVAHILNASCTGERWRGVMTDKRTYTERFAYLSCDLDGTDGHIYSAVFHAVTACIGPSSHLDCNDPPGNWYTSPDYLYDFTLLSFRQTL